MRLLLWLLLLTTFFLAFSCASHRKKANCSEIRYRLDHVQYTEDQREWIEEEWKLCESEYDSLKKVDSKNYQGIYNQFQDSTEKSTSDTIRDSSANGANLESQ